MAATQYQVFCRYYHSSSNHTVLNDFSCGWTAWEDRKDKAVNSAAEVIEYNAIGNPTMTYEHMYIRPEDGLYQDTTGSMKKAAVALDNKLQKLIIDANHNSNPKYDMIFAYDGLASFEGEKKRNPPPTGDKSTAPLVYYEKMRRLDMVPWFLYATCASLSVAMKKGEELVKIMGTSNVLIGKVVALDQYIDIV